MKRIKSYKQFESFFGLFKKPDDDVAKGILSSLEEVEELEIERINNDPLDTFLGQLNVYEFNIDGFDIILSKDFDNHNLLSDYMYTLYVDGVALDVSKEILKRIHRRINYIINKPQNDDNDYIRKDAKIHFGGKNKRISILSFSRYDN